jgi:O-antigen/teichoic acid export membrane protein
LLPNNSKTMHFVKWLEAARARNVIARLPARAKSLLASSEKQWATGTLSILDQGVVSLANLANLLLLGRRSSAEQMGLYVLGFGIVTLASTIQYALITTPFSVYFPQIRDESQRKYSGSTLVHQLGFSALIIIGLAASQPLFSLFGPKGFVSVLGTLQWVIAFILLRDYLRRVCYARLQLVRALFLDLTATLAQIGSLIVLAAWGRISAANVFWIQGGASALAGVSLLLVTRHSYSCQLGLLALHFKKNWRLGKWLVATRGVAAGGLQLLPWLLFMFWGTAAAGVLGVYQSIIQLPNPMINGIGNYVLVRAAHTNATRGEQELRRVIRSSLYAVLVLMGGFVLFLGLFGVRLVHLMYADRYRLPQEILLTFAISQLLWALPLTTESGLTTIERPDIIMKSYLISTAMMLTLGVFLIRRYEIPGAAVTLLLSNLVTAIFRHAKFRELTRTSGTSLPGESRMPSDVVGACRPIGEPEPQTSGKFLGIYFEQLEKSSLPYAVMRNFEGLPESKRGNDIDLMVLPADRIKHRDLLMGAAGRAGWNLVQAIEKTNISSYRLMSAPGSRDSFPEVLMFDLFPGDSWYGARFMNAEDALGRREPLGRIHVLSSFDSIGCLLLHHTLCSGYLGKKQYKPEIAALVRQHGRKFEDWATQIFGRALAQDFVAAVEREIKQDGLGDIPSVQRKLRQALVTRTLLREPLRTSAAWITLALFELRRFFKPMGLVVSIWAEGEKERRTLIEGVLSWLWCFDRRNHAFLDGELRQIVASPLPNYGEAVRGGYRLGRLERDGIGWESRLRHLRQNVNRGMVVLLQEDDGPCDETTRLRPDLCLLVGEDAHSGRVLMKARSVGARKIPCDILTHNGDPAVRIALRIAQELRERNERNGWL